MYFQKLIRTNPQDKVALIARLAAGFVVLPHGMQKMGLIEGGGIESTLGDLATMGVPAFLGYLIIIAEFFGALSLIVGFLTRWSAFWLAIIVGYAGITVHAANGYFFTNMGYEFNLLYVMVCIIVLMLGAGAFSVDAMMMKAGKK